MTQATITHQNLATTGEADDLLSLLPDAGPSSQSLKLDLDLEELSLEIPLEPEEPLETDPNETDPALVTELQGSAEGLSTLTAAVTNTRSLLGSLWSLKPDFLDFKLREPELKRQNLSSPVGDGGLGTGSEHYLSMDEGLLMSVEPEDLLDVGGVQLDPQAFGFYDAAEGVCEEPEGGAKNAIAAAIDIGAYKLGEGFELRLGEELFGNQSHPDMVDYVLAGNYFDLTNESRSGLSLIDEGLKLNSETVAAIENQRVQEQVARIFNVPTESEPVYYTWSQPVETRQPATPVSSPLPKARPATTPQTAPQPVTVQNEEATSPEPVLAAVPNTELLDQEDDAPEGTGLKASTAMQESQIIEEHSLDQVHQDVEAIVPKPVVKASEETMQVAKDELTEIPSLAEFTTDTAGFASAFVDLKKDAMTPLGLEGEEAEHKSHAAARQGLIAGQTLIQGAQPEMTDVGSETLLTSVNLADPSWLNTEVSHAEAPQVRPTHLESTGDEDITHTTVLAGAHFFFTETHDSFPKFSTGTTYIHALLSQQQRTSHSVSATRMPQEGFVYIASGMFLRSEQSFGNLRESNRITEGLSEFNHKVKNGAETQGGSDGGAHDHNQEIYVSQVDEVEDLDEIADEEIALAGTYRPTDLMRPADVMV